MLKAAAPVPLSVGLGGRSPLRSTFSVPLTEPLRVTELGMVITTAWFAVPVRLNEAAEKVPEQVRPAQLRAPVVSTCTTWLAKGPTIVPKLRSVFFVSVSGETMFTVAVAEAWFDGAARAGVLRARAARAPAEIRSLFITDFPTGSDSVFGGCPS